jgi:PAS domain S-box-containing protein
MSAKPTYEELEQRVRELEKAESERKRAEEAMRESEDKFKYVFEASNVGMSITQPGGEINVNKAFADILGYTQEELRDKPWQELTPANEIEACQRIIDPLLQGKEDAIRFTKRYLHKDGSYIWADISVIIRRDDEGKPLYFVAAVVDITERKRMDVEASARAEISRIFLKAAPMETIFRELAESLVSKLGFPIAAIELYDPGRGEMAFEGIAGMPGIPVGLRVPVSQTISGTVATGGNEVCETQAGQRSEYQFEALRQLGVETFICLPLRIGERVIGTLSLADQRSRNDAASWVENLRVIATSLSLEIQRR